MEGRLQKGQKDGASVCEEEIFLALAWSCAAAADALTQHTSGRTSHRPNHGRYHSYRRQDDQ